MAQAEKNDDTPETKYLNDAKILGVEPEGLSEFLAREATFLTGEMWGQRDRRNTQDGDWNGVSMTWGQWAGGQDKSANMAAWGLSRHPEGKDKAGASLVLGSSVGGARKAKAMDTMYAMGLDIDSGAKLDSVLDTLEQKGILCFVYTSFNNGKRGLELKRDDVLRKLQITRDPTESEIRQFLRDFDKNRYEESFIAGCSITTQKHQTTEGVKIVLDTPPLEKFRLFFPLETPVKLIDLADTQQAALDMWENKITGLARNVLDVHFDTSCTDPSRLFYTARHLKGTDDWHSAIVLGSPLVFDDIPAMKKSAYTSNRDDNAFTQAGANDNHDRPPMALTPSGKSLNDWHSNGGKDHFMIADLLETLCPDKVRHSGGEAQGTVHTECPFEHEHTSEGGTATMAVNCLDSQSEYWTWFCHHDACQSRHKLQLLEEALRQNWFDEEALFDTDLGFLLEPADEEVEPEEESVIDDDTPRFNNDTPEKDLRKTMKRVAKTGDATDRARLTTEIVESTRLGKRDVNALWKKVDKELKDTAPADAGGAIVNQWDFEDLHIYGNLRVHEENTKNPTVFSYLERLASVRTGADGRPRISMMAKAGYAHFLNTVATFEKVSGDDGNRIGVAAPREVVDYLFEEDHAAYPPLRGLITTPIFTRHGSLLTKAGYDIESQLYYKPDAGLVVPQVSNTPTPEEVEKAKRLLIQEVLADFPLGGLTRPEIMAQGLHGNGVPAVANVLGLILLPFLREMIDGATAGHLILKPTAGTGASYLSDVTSIISTGAPAPAMAMPKNSEEMSKTLTAVFANGQNIVFFDNINNEVDSGELASAMTTPTYMARLLGSSQTVSVDVRCAWVFNGNSVKLSSELVRRLTLIDLDADMESPELRTGFLHDDIRGWVREHRSELVWACLTLIQNWVAQGMVHQKDTVLASFENWSGVVGGVLKAAGIGGFMGNRDMLKVAANRDTDSPEAQLKARILGDDWHKEAGWEKYEVGQVFVTGNTKRMPYAVSIKELLEDFFEGDPLYINGWGYDKHAQTYNDPARLGRSFAAWADTFRADRDGGTYKLEKGDNGGTKRWTLTFTKKG